MIVWDWYGFHKKRARTHYTKLVFLYLVGYAGQVVHSSASEARNIDKLFLIVMWDRYGFHKKCVRTPYAEYVFLHPVVPVGHVVHFGASVACNVGELTLNLSFCIWWYRR
jgi:hypothetical protein